MACRRPGAGPAAREEREGRRRREKKKREKGKEKEKKEKGEKEEKGKEKGRKNRERDFGKIRKIVRENWEGVLRGFFSVFRASAHSPGWR
jgi:hypothetical protein